jgi:hypothetical protein
VPVAPQVDVLATVGAAESETEALQTGSALAAIEEPGPTASLAREYREFAKLDSDGNQLIDFEEFLAGQPPQVLAQSSREDIQLIFDDADLDGNGVLDFGEFVEWRQSTLGGAMTGSAYAIDQQFARVRQLNKYANLDLGLRRAQTDVRTLRSANRVSRRATLIAPLATVSVISLAQYVSRPDFDFPGLDAIKEAWRLQQIRVSEPAGEEAASAYFPGNLASAAVDHLVEKTLKKRGFTSENTLFATSVCPDEVNSKTRELADLLTTRYGEDFTLGGLGGIPFTGTAGFTAYSHHVPDNTASGGKMFVLFAPHVGIDFDGKVGKLRRDSQKGVSTACGAAVGAYNAVNAKAKKALQMAEVEMSEVEKAEMRGSDAQIEFIKKRLAQGLVGIENAPDPIAFVTYQMYQIMREFFVLELKSADGIWDYADELTVLGGIQINRASGGDRFMPLMFQTRKQPAGTTVDLFADTFGGPPDLRVPLGEKNVELSTTFNSGIEL